MARGIKWKKDIAIEQKNRKQNENSNEESEKKRITKNDKAESKNFVTLEQYEALLKDIHKVKETQGETFGFIQNYFVSKPDFQSSICSITKALHGTASMYCNILSDEKKSDCMDLSNKFLNTLKCSGDLETIE